MFYPPESDREPYEVRREDYIDAPIVIEWLKRPAAVQREFKAISPDAAEDDLAALYAGVIKGGSHGKADERLDKLMKEAGRIDANARKRLARRGRDLLDPERKEYAAEKAVERREGYEEALTRDDLANPSLDPAEMLGDDMQSALANLSKRYSPADMGRKFRVVRKPDLSAFGSDINSTIIVYGKQDFVDLHLDRQLSEGDRLVNPAQFFLETEKRKSRMLFAPTPQVLTGNE